MSQKYQTSIEHQEINLAMNSMILLVILVGLTFGQGYGDGEYSQMKQPDACNCKDSTLPGIDCAALFVECANPSVSYLCPVTCHSKPTCCL